MKYRLVLDALYRSANGLLAFTLYGRYHLQPEEAVDFIDRYSKGHYISIDENQRIILTQKGRDNINYLLDELVAPSKQEPEYLRLIRSSEKLSIFEPYLPKDEFFQRIKEQESEVKN